MEDCISCHERPIEIAKWRRCLRCYQSYRKKKGMKGRDNTKERTVAYPSEIDFIKSYFTHNNWQYHPAFFRLNGGSYEPDFYDGERNVFIEVAGTRQAFHQNLEKYREFLNTFPMLKFEVRNAKGGLIAISDLRGKFRGETP